MKKIICICSATLLLLTGCGTKDPCKEGHTWTDATCKEPKTCQVCSITEGVTVEHSYSEYNTIAEPTCAKNGKEEAVCIWCKIKDQRELPKLEHSFKWEITTPATANSEGVNSLRCKVCGEITLTEKIPKEPPKVTTPDNTNTSNSSSQLKNNSIGIACDYINSAINDFVKAKKILTDVETIYNTNQTDSRISTYCNNVATLLEKTVKSNIYPAIKIYVSNNANTYALNLIPYMTNETVLKSFPGIYDKLTLLSIKYDINEAIELLNTEIESLKKYGFVKY